MSRGRLIFIIPLLWAVSCNPEEPEVNVPAPALRLSCSELTPYGAKIQIETIHALSVQYGISCEGIPSLESRLEVPSTGSERLSVQVELEPNRSYVFAARCFGRGEKESSLQQLEFTTGNGPAKLYSWERARSGVPVPADMTLIAGHSSHRNPLAWEEERWQSHVSWTDDSGTEHWLFDSFLLIEGQQTGVFGSSGHTYVLTESPTPSADKQLWQQMIDFWFNGGDFPWQESYWGDGENTFGRWYTGKMVQPDPQFTAGQLDALDACVGHTAARIGAPATKRYVIVSIPEPIYFDNYIASVRDPAHASSVYWGELDGKPLDFSLVDHRLRACYWFIDQVRSAFEAKHYSNIELLGFYILPEVLDTRWRAEYKRYDKVIPAIAEYLHACNEGLFWIPYYLAEGYKTWKDFGFDAAYMQPNHYWDENGSKPLSTAFHEIMLNGMGLELEFEYTMVAGVNGQYSADKYRGRFRDYLKWARTSGVYGTRPLALYSGTDAMHQLANSKDGGDREMYYELCRFITDSPLRQ